MVQDTKDLFIPSGFIIMIGSTTMLHFSHGNPTETLLPSIMIAVILVVVWFFFKHVKHSMELPQDEEQTNRLGLDLQACTSMNI